MKQKILYPAIFLIILITLITLTWGGSEQTHGAVPDEFTASCNMNSGGYVNYLNGKYYYADAEHNYSLYMSNSNGKNAVCIDSCTDETISCITTDETAVYYIKSKRLDKPLKIGDYTVLFEKQICRFRNGKVTVLSEENVMSYALSKDYIFYATADLKVYRMKHDGTEKTAIYELLYPMTISVSGNKLYLHRDEEIITADFDGKNPFTSRLYLYNKPAFNESTLYFIDLNGYILCKTELSDKDTYAAIDNIQPVIDENVRSYTVYNGRLVYEKMQTNEIVIADMNGDNPQVVCTGTYPIALNGHLFYLDNGVIKVADI